MKTWSAPDVPDLPGTGVPPRLYDTARGQVLPVDAGPVASLYVCGVTPYDTTHMGHAATYVTFDLLGRALRDAGHEVRYVQNVTDVDDPLLERATRDGIDWRELAAEQIALFHADMEALSVIPPAEYVGVVEAMDLIVAAVARLKADGAAYEVPTPDAEGNDLYLDIATVDSFGEVSHLDRDAMLAIFPERGGDPDREGKRDPLDPLLWRAERDGEPAWEGGDLGRGRPGWHIECTAIALHHLGAGFDVQGGGTDLVFPHHEMSAAQSELLHAHPFARFYAHQAMVGYQGEKMSKSRGNLVRVAQLRAQGVDPAAIRLVLLGHHYRTDWEWFDRDLDAAVAQVERWRRAVTAPVGPPSDAVLLDVRAALADDLDTPRALAVVDRWVEQCLDGVGHDALAPRTVAAVVDALLGIKL